CATGKLLVGVAQLTVQNYREPSACTVSADRDMLGRNALLPQKTPGGQGIFHRRRERMLGRQPISHRQRSYPCGPTGLGHHATMAAEGPGTVTSAMEEQQTAEAVAAGHALPFPRHAVEIDRIELHVAGDRPERADLVEAL